MRIHPVTHHVHGKGNDIHISSSFSIAKQSTPVSYTQLDVYKRQVSVDALFAVSPDVLPDAEPHATSEAESAPTKSRDNNLLLFIIYFLL